MMFDSVSHNVHISSNEGKDWSLASGIPEGSISKLVEHPFGHNMAFAIGKDSTHWVTYNRGESWLRWDIGAEGRQARMGGEVLSFHAEQEGKPSALVRTGSTALEAKRSLA
jgi:hypothetical protein